MPTFAPQNGALAHLARAFDWQSRGGEFESRMLHKSKRQPADIQRVSSFFHAEVPFYYDFFTFKAGFCSLFEALWS